MGAAGDPAAEGRDLTPADLLSAIAERQDRAAFIRLFEEFAPRLKSYARRLGADGAVAEDLVQEVMLTAWTRAAQFDRTKASVATWLFTIARNRRIDMIRRERRPEPDPDDPALVRAPDPPADTVVEAEQHERLVRAALAELPEEQGRILRMAFFDDKSHSDIARELALPLGTVKSRVRLAMGKLRARLKDAT